MNPLKSVLTLLSSYGSACVLLFLLLLLTLFGTLEQVDSGLYVVQQKYFESFFLVHWQTIGSFSFPIPLVGAHPLMILLFFNLLYGALIRGPKNWRRPGMLIAHSGILILILSAFVTAQLSHSGHMTLFEGESSHIVDDYYDWEVAITELGKPEGARTFTVVNDQIEDIPEGEKLSFTSADLPFALELSDFTPNAAPRQAAPMLNETGIDGVVMAPLPMEKESERNLAGITATVIPADGGEAKKTLLWALAAAPWTVALGEKSYAITLRHKRYEVPFTITLDKFIRDLHPRTMMASNFESEVTKTQDGSARKLNIRMNEPLRDSGYTFFQASWGPEDAKPGEPLFSTFAVVNNPADQWPKYACYVIGIGMLIHFAQKLAGYIRQQNRRRPS